MFFPLVNTLKYKIPDDIRMENEIPTFASMSTDLQSHYKNLYLCACYPSLLYTASQSGIDQAKLPNNVLGINQLIYCIFLYRLAHSWENGRHTKITCMFNPLVLNPEGEIVMFAKDGLYQSLLQKLQPLYDISPVLYFIVTLLSLNLIPNADTLAEANYFMHFSLLGSLLSPGNPQMQINDFRENKQELRRPWIADYLPDLTNTLPPLILNAEIITQAKELLLGNHGIFHQPQAVIDAQNSNNRKKPHALLRCLPV